MICESLRREGYAQPACAAKRMGHIELAAPVVHILVLQSDAQAALGSLLAMKDHKPGKSDLPSRIMW